MAIETKCNTIGKFVGFSNKDSCFSFIPEFAQVKFFMFFKHFLADVRVRIGMVGMFISTSIATILTGIIISLKNSIYPRMFKQAMDHTSKGTHATLPIMVIFALMAACFTRAAAFYGWSINSCTTKFCSAINTKFVSSYKFYCKAHPKRLALYALLTSIDKIAKILVWHLEVVIFKNSKFILCPINLFCHIYSNENPVNCWENLRAYYTTT